MATCKNKDCKKKFDKIRANQVVCSYPCASAYTKQLREKKEKQHWNAKKKLLKEKLKSYSDHLKEVQVVFNQFIRLRDEKLPCISCQRFHEKQYHAGHYKSVGSSPELRFNPLNVHKQCAYCNTYLHGNLIEYRKNLINKIGLEEVYNLDRNKKARKYCIPELIEMKVIYKDKIKALNK